SKEGELLRVENEENLRIYLVPGRQFVSREKLEILALAYAGPELDGRESREILHELFEKKACAVLPWSPGKWAGKRGALIKSLIEQRERFNFLLGDIAMRSFYEPRVFQTAKNYGIGILAGSDSLPLSG